MATHPLIKFRKSRTPPWTQEDLANAVGVKRLTVLRWEHGTRFPERKMWPRIRAVTGLGVEELNRRQ